jgi:hypothetical protein
VAVSCTPASEGLHPTPHSLVSASARPRYLALAGPFTGQVVWVCVVGHARCGGDRRNPGQRSPVRVQIGRARQEAAAAIVGDTTGQVAGVGDLAAVRAATGAGAGLADASRITPRSCR